MDTWHRASWKANGVDCYQTDCNLFISLRISPKYFLLLIEHINHGCVYITMQSQENEEPWAVSDTWQTANKRGNRICEVNWSPRWSQRTLGIHDKHGYRTHEGIIEFDVYQDSIYKIATQWLNVKALLAFTQGCVVRVRVLPHLQGLG